MANWSSSYFLFGHGNSLVDMVREINNLQEERRKINIEVNLPPDLITRKIYDEEFIEKNGYRNCLTVEILCTTYIDVEGQIASNAVNKILRRYCLR